MKSKFSVLTQKTRCFSAVAAFQVLMTFISPALWVLTSPQSTLARVSHLALSGTAIGWCWLAASALILPFIIMQIISPTSKHRRLITKMCNYGSLLGGLTWFFMAFVARDLDYNFVVTNLIINGIGSFVLAALLADGLNDDQIEIREYRLKDRL